MATDPRKQAWRFLGVKIHEQRAGVAGAALAEETRGRAPARRARSRRALVDPDVLILDEATSSRSIPAPSAVERALGRLTEGRTVITIAHRLSTARRADRVVVLEQGRLVEHGAHASSSAPADRYAALWSSRRSGAARSPMPPSLSDASARL